MSIDIPQVITQAVRQSGISPKVIAAAVAAFVAPLVVGFLAEQVGLTVEVGTAEAILGAVVLAAITALSSAAAKPGAVVVEDTRSLEATVAAEDPDSSPSGA